LIKSIQSDSQEFIQSDRTLETTVPLKLTVLNNAEYHRAVYTV